MHLAIHCQLAVFTRAIFIKLNYHGYGHKTLMSVKRQERQISIVLYFEKLTKLFKKMHTLNNNYIYSR